ncbi:unnamed protein product [Closterium sp. NIES-53]
MSVKQHTITAKDATAMPMIAPVGMAGGREGEIMQGRFSPLRPSLLPPCEQPQVFIAAGTIILWVGFFGFNGGSVQYLGQPASVWVADVARVCANTTVCAAFAGVAVWFVTYRRKEPNLEDTLNGATMWNGFDRSKQATTPPCGGLPRPRWSNCAVTRGAVWQWGSLHPHQPCSAPTSSLTSCPAYHPNPNPMPPPGHGGASGLWHVGQCGGGILRITSSSATHLPVLRPRALRPLLRLRRLTAARAGASEGFFASPAAVQRTYQFSDPVPCGLFYICGGSQLLVQVRSGGGIIWCSCSCRWDLAEV